MARDLCKTNKYCVKQQKQQKKIENTSKDMSRREIRAYREKHPSPHPQAVPSLDHGGS
jgi:hypothetical protein